MITPALLHYTRPKAGSAYIGNLTKKLAGWRHSIDDRVGFKIATAEWNGSVSEEKEFFLYGLGTEIKARVGETELWAGLVIQLEMNIGGVTWTRNLLDVANHVRAVYSSIGDNLLTNGGGESGVWAAYGSPTTREQSTTWRTRGSYSIHLVTSGAGAGAYIQQNVAISAGNPYDLRVSVKLVTGSFRLVIAESADHTNVLARTDISDAGEAVVYASVPDASTFTGNVDIWLESLAAAEIYCDAAVFQRGPMRAESSIYEDATSQGQFGRMEAVLLRAGMTTSAANAEAQTYLRKHAWPKSIPPVDFFERSYAGRLQITLAGWGATLNFRHTTVTGTDTCSNHVTSLVTASEFITAGVIETNSTSYQIENRSPLRVRDVLSDIADVGDGSGKRWSVGVFEGRKLNYVSVPQVARYQFSKGVMYYPNGRAVVEPWVLRPGWVYLADAPMSTRYAGTDATDDPRMVYAQEVEYIAPDKFSWRRAED